MGFNPLHKDRRQLLDAARTGDGRPLPHQLKAEILREIELIELLLRQIAEVEAVREVLAGPKTAKAPSPVVLLKQLKGIDPETASVLYFEGLFRASAIAASWRPMRGSRQHHGGAARSTRSKAYPKRVIGVCTAP